MNRKAIIFGIKTYNLTNKEKALFKKEKPWGIILFSRNIKNIEQLKKLISDIKSIFDDNKYPILIDQEGGKVSRINSIIDLNFFSQNFFSNLYRRDKNLFYIFYKIYINKVSDIFNEVGININTAPVLDVMVKKAHSIIGNRSFSTDAKLVSKIGGICVKTFSKNKIGTVVKHIPGHGKALSDSHFQTPFIKASKQELKKNDFRPFKEVNSFFAMTAHIIYSSFDRVNTATHSKKIISNVIRRYINFKGILISDDISMKSLKYSLRENALKALNSGCNLVLHCNGNIKEMTNLIKVIPKINNFTKKKTSAFYKFLG